MPRRRLRLVLGLILLQGCCHSPADQTDPVVLHLADQIRDIEPAGPAEQAPPPRPVDERTLSRADQTNLPDWDRTVIPAAFQEKDKPRRRELVMPPALPGATLPPIRLPDPKDEKARELALSKIYPPLPPLPPDLQLGLGPEGRPLTLADLQHLAALHNPSIKNAVAAVEAARGAMRQAGAYPNPSLIYAADTVGTGGAGYQGGGIDQPIKGGNKLKLQEGMAAVDLRNAVVALRRAQSDLATQVRSNYFAALVARENVRISRALAIFNEQFYLTQLNIVRAGEAASYEPMQLRPQVLQARFNLIQAINQYKASWLQLTAAVGLPEMPCTQLAGRVDLPVPLFHYEEVLSKVLSRHTDVLTAENAVQKARYALELAQVTPFPDFDVHFLVQKDYTTGPTNMTHALVYTADVSFPIPVWDQNKGGIYQAEHQLIQAAVQPQQTRLTLTNTLADAFNRYVTNRDFVRITRQQVEDQVRVLPMLYNRYQTTAGEVVFSDLVAAVQTLGGYTSAYVTALGLQWTAVVDVANLLQTDDLFGIGPMEEVTPVPDLEELLHLPDYLRGTAHFGACAPAADELGCHPISTTQEDKKLPAAPPTQPAAGDRKPEE